MTRRTLFVSVVAAVAVVAGIVLFLATRQSSGHVGQFVNAAIDNLAAVGDRLLELPLFMLLAGAAVLSAAVALPVLRWGTATGRITLTRAAVVVVIGGILFGLAVHADRKIVGLQQRVIALHNDLNRVRMTGAEPAVMPATSIAVATTRSTTTRAVVTTTKPVSSAPRLVKASPRTSYLIDTAQIQRNLTVQFGSVGFHPIIHDPATDIVEVDIQKLPAIAYMAIVDLRTPGLEIKFGGSLTEKTLTTDFARANKCQIAINGEAGNAPRANSGLGTWRGNMVSAGKVVMKEEAGNKRPFLSFDRQSIPTFTPATAADRTFGPDKYNVIWGRWDALTNGTVFPATETDRQPRTAMGINQEGTKLYLLVVDGRQQRYSVGFTRQEAGMFLQTFGAHNAMLCDEGGSSCIYAKKYDRILNSPSDGGERATYTHFGISLTQ
jgi:hypothetical protein